MTKLPIYTIIRKYLSILRPQIVRYPSELLTTKQHSSFFACKQCQQFLVCYFHYVIKGNKSLSSGFYKYGNKIIVL